MPDETKTCLNCGRRARKACDGFKDLNADQGDIPCWENTSAQEAADPGQDAFFGIDVPEEVPDPEFAEPEDPTSALFQKEVCVGKVGAVISYLNARGPNQQYLIIDLTGTG